MDRLLPSDALPDSGVLVLLQEVSTDTAVRIAIIKTAALIKMLLDCFIMICPFRCVRFSSKENVKQFFIYYITRRHIRTILSVTVKVSLIQI